MTSEVRQETQEEQIHGAVYPLSAERDLFRSISNPSGRCGKGFWLCLMHTVLCSIVTMVQKIFKWNRAPREAGGKRCDGLES